MVPHLLIPIHPGTHLSSNIDKMAGDRHGLKLFDWMRNKPPIAFYKHEKPNVYFFAKCGVEQSRQLLLVFPFFWDFFSNLDWLDLEMEANEGEHQALQILRNMLKKLVEVLRSKSKSPGRDSRSSEARQDRETGSHQQGCNASIQCLLEYD